MAVVVAVLERTFSNAHFGAALEFRALFAATVVVVVAAAAAAQRAERAATTAQSHVELDSTTAAAAAALVCVCVCVTNPAHKATFGCAPSSSLLLGNNNTFAYFTQHQSLIVHLLFNK